MKINRSRSAGVAHNKASSGIPGFDEITGGGLPAGRTTLLVGGPGAGKTIFSLQFLVHGARSEQEPGIYVAFEETSSLHISAQAGQSDAAVAKHLVA